MQECLKIEGFQKGRQFSSGNKELYEPLVGNISVREMFLLECSFEDRLCIKYRGVATELMTDRL